MPLRHLFSFSTLIALVFLASPFAQAKGKEKEKVKNEEVKEKPVCPPNLDGKTAIIIGGNGATTKAMANCYKDSPEILAIGESDGKALVECLANLINARKGPEKFIVAGHSTGSAHAEHIVQSKSLPDKNKVRLVLLEGYGATANQKGVETNCWYAKSDTAQGFNASSMTNKKVCPSGATPSSSSHCGSNPLCLHVSLLNSNASPKLTRANVFSEGLGTKDLECKGNREWLGKEPSAAPVHRRTEPQAGDAGK